jgi:hypothetical protein
VTSTADHIIENITAQMIRDTASWSQSEHDLRDTLRLAAVALEAAEAERDALRKALAPFMGGQAAEIVAEYDAFLAARQDYAPTARLVASDAIGGKALDLLRMIAREDRL